MTKSVGYEDIVQEIKNQRLNWQDTCIDSIMEFAKVVWEEIPLGNSPLGLPRIRWMDNIVSDLHKMNITFQLRLMEDRTAGKKLCRQPRLVALHDDDDFPSFRQLLVVLVVNSKCSING